MPRVTIGCDDAYPVFFVQKYRPRVDTSGVEVPQETLDKWNVVLLEYENMQQEMEEYYRK